MATFYIMNDPETNALWLVDSETQTIEPLDRDLIASSGLAGSEFIDSIANRPGNIFAADASRSDATGRAHSSSMVMTAGRRNDPSDRAHFFGPESKEADIVVTVNARDETSDRAHSSSPSCGQWVPQQSLGACAFRRSGSGQWVPQQSVGTCAFRWSRGTKLNTVASALSNIWIVCSKCVFYGPMEWQ